MLLNPPPQQTILFIAISCLLLFVDIYEAKPLFGQVRNISLNKNIIFKHGRVLPITNQTLPAVFDWSGVSFTSGFKVKSEQVLDIKVILTMHDVGNLYNVYLWMETENQRKLVSNQILTTISSPIPKQYTVRFTFLGDPEALFTFEFEKRTEAFLGSVTLFDVQLQSTLDIELQEQKSKDFKGKLIVEFLGDSLSCAYGNLGKPPCGYSVTTQDVHQSFVVKTAQYLKADEYHVQCWSGKGVVRNYADPGTTSKDPFPIYYPRTVANQNISNWNFAGYVPNVVVITLGGNDFSTAPRPSYEQYYGGYINLLQFVYGKYSSNSDLKVVLVCGPLEFDCWDNFTERVTNQAAPQFPQNSLYFLSMHNLLDPNTDIGCASHPNVQGDEKMAKLLSSFIQNNVLSSHN